ncbi:MAG: class I SAM-dependent methyltransferase [Candidatus Omnitrophota bacterium]|jgi:predicted O-methyltransferase YrrM
MYIFALANSLYVLTIGYIFKKNRKLVSNMCEIFGYQKFKELRHPEIRLTIPTVDIADVAEDTIPIELREMPWKDGNVTLLELAIINRLIRKYSPKKILEIGTYDGRTTLNLAANSPKDSVIYTLDLPQTDKPAIRSSALANDESFVDKVKTGVRFHGTEFEKKIVQLTGDSATFDFTPYNNSMDLVFIDGAHTYDYILNDTAKVLKLLKGGKGIILWHDYSWVWGDVAKALNSLYVSNAALKNIRHIKGTSLVIYIAK